MTDLQETVTIGVQSSGDDERTEKHIVELRSLLRRHCVGPYSPHVQEFALVFRMGGNMQEFNFEGCDRIRRSKKQKYITVDLGFPSNRWRKTSDDSIRAYLAESVETGLLSCLRRLSKDRVAMDAERLMADYVLVKSRYMDQGHKDASL